MAGGIQNNKTGLGTRIDNVEATFVAPTRWYGKKHLEVVYEQVAAAKKLVNIPVDDAIEEWRRWKGDAGDTAVEAMVDAEKRHKVKKVIRNAWRLGRRDGTALVTIHTKEAPLDTPLMPERIREGDLTHMLVWSRYSATVAPSARSMDPLEPGYGFSTPEEYYVIPDRGRAFYIHRSRVLRFDGSDPLEDDGFDAYDWDWGNSVLLSAIRACLQDEVVAQSMAHLSQVASIPVISVSRLRDAFAGQQEDTQSAEEIAEDINQRMSVFRLLMLEKGSEEFNRVAVNFSGLDKLVDRIERRLAWHGDIPHTRFMGASPDGMNATGESDWRNYRKMVMARRDDTLEAVLDQLDPVLARDAGLPETPDWEFPDLLLSGDAEKAATAKTKAEAFGLLLDKGVVDEDEAREALDGDPVFGALPGEAPGLPEPVMPSGMDPAKPMPNGKPKAGVPNRVGANATN